MSPLEFEKLVAEIGLSPVPEKFRDDIKNVAVLIEDDVTPEIRRQAGISNHESLLGFYHGVPHTARGGYYGIGTTYPDVIRLFRVPILRTAEETGQSVREVIEETIWHEIAHHFGLDDDEIERRARK